MKREQQPFEMSSLLPIFLIALVCAMAIVLADNITRGQIEINRQKAILSIIDDVMPLAHDNNLYADRIELAELSTTVYRARQGEKPVGLVFMPLHASGYSGEIKIAVGISYDGTLGGVRIIEHRETAGLGDGVDQKVSNWIFQFDHRSLQNTTAEGWAVAGEGGEFDQLSGATISPRAVINAVKTILDYYALNRDKLYL